MSNTLCEGCGQHSFLIPLHGGKGGPLHPRHFEIRSRTAPRYDAATAGARGCYRAGAEGRCGVSTDTPQGDGRSEAGRVMNRRERRALAAQGLLPDIDETLSEIWDLPIFHIAISRNKGSEVILALSPRRWCDLQAAFAIEFANGLRIQKDRLSELATHSGHSALHGSSSSTTVCSRCWWHDHASATRVTAPRKWRRCLQTSSRIRAKPLPASKESRLHDLVIWMLSEQVSIDASDPIAKLSWTRADPSAPPGKRKLLLGSRPRDAAAPREVHKSNFFEGTVAIAKAFRGNTSAYHNTVALRSLSHAAVSVRGGHARLAGLSRHRVRARKWLGRQPVCEFSSD